MAAGETGVRPAPVWGAPHHKCAPHRCWPSILGWGGFTLALIYVVFMYSFHGTEHSKTEQHMGTLGRTVVQIDRVDESQGARLTAIEARLVTLEERKPRRWWERR